MIVHFNKDCERKWDLLVNVVLSSLGGHLQSFHLLEENADRIFFMQN